MECCYPTDCQEYAVTPVLVAPSCPTKCYDEPAICFPCLPRCTKPVTYCYEKKCPKLECREEGCVAQDCCPPTRPRPKSPPIDGQSPQYCNPGQPTCKPVKTKYVIPCYRYEDGRIVSKLPVSAFKRNGMQDQEHSKMLGSTNYLVRHPQDVSIECDVCMNITKVGDPAKVPLCSKTTPLGSCFLRKKPIEVSLEDILDD